MVRWPWVRRPQSTVARRCLQTPLEEDPADYPTMIIHITPEKVMGSMVTLIFLRELHRLGLLNGFVVDEAHCVVEHGLEFRPDYLRLKLLREAFPEVATSCPL